MAAPSLSWTEGLPDTQTMHLIGDLENGKVVTIFFSKTRPERRTLAVKQQTSQLVWIRAQGVRPEGAINFRDIKEVRRVKKSKDFDKWSDDARRVDDKRCFVIYHGNDFKLRTLSVVVDSSDERENWFKGLDLLIQEAKSASHTLVVERWLTREYNSILERDGRVTLKAMKSWTTKINCKLTTNKLKEKYQSVDKEKKGAIVQEEFTQLYHFLVHVPTVIDEYFVPFMRKLHTDRVATVEKLHQFVTQEQRESLGQSEVKEVMKNFLSDPGREIHNKLFFTEQEFVDYLFSGHNTIWDSKYNSVTQDMNRPLSHYWIASSHNTYLTGDQFSSESSVEAYARCLKMGCKCLELDCWDGPDGYPKIYHGHTLTSQIRFLDVVKAIKENAWAVSDYPLILSIENHCSLGQQRNMASAFKDIFGDMLLTEPIQRDSNMLPSPDHLKRKIILKHKKLPADPSQADPQDFTVDDNTRDGDLSNSVKNGILYLEDPIDNTWTPHFFVLTPNRMYYSEETNNAEEEEEEEEENGVRKEDELHFREKWFHGRLAGGRLEAEKKLREYSHLGDGTFLVRDSDTFVGDFSLSFKWNTSINHCRIKSKQEMGQVKYFLRENAMFDSLYSLIAYYRSPEHKLRVQDIELVLKTPCPQPIVHEGNEWYNSNVDRDQAEEMLRRIPYDGAFLVRPSIPHGCGDPGTSPTFAISFRAEGKIKHCRIRQEGRLFTMGDAEFESLPELVRYYEKNSLYKKMKLRKPVNQSVVDREGQEPTEQGLYGLCGQTDIYINPNDFTSQEPNMDPESLYEPGIYHSPNVFTSKVRVKALHDYGANHEDELTFYRGAVITNVNKHDNGWWRGDYQDKKQYWFPANFVVEIESQDDSGDNTPLGSLQKGAIDVTSCIVESIQGRGNKPCCFRIYSPSLVSGDLDIACDAESEMLDWIENIRMCADNLQDQATIKRQRERRNQIAQEFSDLIVYCIAVQFNFDKIQGSGNCLEMSSFQEIKAESLCSKSKARQFIKYNNTQLSRVYPKGARIDSTNYNPMPMWNCGSQLCALNYQTPDRSMQLNQGRFLQNGMCGYVLQPECMRSEDYSPFDKKSIKVDPLTISISVIGARHLVKQKQKIVSPFVELEIVGLDCDNNKFKTFPASSNGLNPVWSKQNYDFDIRCPDLAMIRFVVYDEDMFGDPNVLGQATFPIKCLRPGYRSVPLKNEYSEPHELSSLLVYIEMKNPQEEEDSEIYSCLQDLQDKKDDLTTKLQELELQGDMRSAQQCRQKLQETEDTIITKSRERQHRKGGDFSYLIQGHISNSMWNESALYQSRRATLTSLSEDSLYQEDLE
ncbi:1-phosphatidylinositol 4,5-bisphosphate phosphodiesterase gamma-1-like isoform X4 [Mya arenaria]|uniref:1-phosphatidylinositol 4,5-bisphosphate phosphodiesterase gamma-1-like isoform X4 n=1 Tax=Mya arenaria TaxID=6604 RepID=UPI0022E412B8|nr:1-phosphatidylinositol 4,5-bisphosphate phosphodiesterase gamma-1-like isoform X4 [Mya arenaria]XP_052817774.1 1-phosphatidylinositol 4,5-bisphosphate phosphodiesterase gamma-1-like isoform X4 [Mya arenaria]